LIFLAPGAGLWAFPASAGKVHVYKRETAPSGTIGEPRRCGGTGRRARLKIAFPKGSVGSIPSTGTINFEVVNSPQEIPAHAAIAHLSRRSAPREGGPRYASFGSEVSSNRVPLRPPVTACRDRLLP